MFRWAIYCAVGVVTLVLSLPAAAQWSGNDDAAPVYQRHAFEYSPQDDARWHGRRPQQHGGAQPPQYMAPQVQSGWFQRPYPYHLDYYRMRYGGSYAPYFGNLYGPPVYYGVPPYYGSYYGGYGGYGGYGPYPYGYGPMEQPAVPPVEANPGADGAPVP